MKNLLFTAILLILPAAAFSQEQNAIQPTSAEQRLKGYKKRIELQKNSLLKNVVLTSIGPTVQSGRVTDIDVSPFDETNFYVAYASGGVWKTINNGISFTPIFDDQASMTVGDIAVDWKNNVVYVGTGENNSSRSSYAGTGIYKTTDDGKTWQYLGLAETQHIGRIILHPGNPNVIWIAATGHLYSPNKERGVYKTTDGGKTWKQTLYIDDNTGTIDLVINPKNPDELYAAMWYRTRRAWNFEESGSSSGIYKSTDGGETWTLITTKESGFPAGEGVGRIGLAVFPANPNILYAALDNQFHRKEKEKEEFAVTKNLIRTISKNDFLKLKEEDIEEYLRREGFPKEYTAGLVMKMVKENKIKPLALVNYLEDANALLFDTPIIGLEIYRSDDAGKTWRKTHKDFLDGVVHTYGYYFGQIGISPVNPDKIYVMGVPILKSEDGGKNFKSIAKENVHADHHALWISQKRDRHLIDGNDGGLNISYDDGETWINANSPAVGQFYSVAYDMDKPFNVYGGLQDNGVWVGPSNNKENYEWIQTGHYAFKNILGSDGMQVQVDTRDNNTVYAGFQFGNYYRINKQTGESKRITPKHKLGENPFRFNWQAPIKLSPHNQDILYLGSNKLHRSLDKGETWAIISGDLTKGGRKGDVPYGTLTTIDESPLKFGLIYTGSDDGLVYVTRDGGNSWERISDKLPQNYWISRVAASNFNEGAVYVSLNGYRWDNFDALVYKSTDYGETWERIGLDLPDEPVNVVKEDPVNKNIIYVGTDNGLYVSLNGGENFMALFKGMPAVAVHDLVIQPRDRKLVAATHGRSLYTADVSYIEKLTDSLLQQNLVFFELNTLTFNERWGNKRYVWTKPYIPEVNFVFYSNKSGNAKIKIMTDSGIELKKLNDESERGLNFVKYDLTIDSSKKAVYEKSLNQNKKEKTVTLKNSDDGNIYLQPGKYKVEIEINGIKQTQDFEIKEQKKDYDEESSPAQEEEENDSI